ncbi:MAG: B12-binding domain-containing radical SAM protein [Saprospiraceae bacterium]|nr:B12-binding domain-containing radical SAM protein [Saprospiraceae bacterium]
MKVLFTHGYFLADDPKEQRIMKPYPPLGLLYLSAWLDLTGIENEVFDTTFSSKQLLQQHLLKNPPRVLALYTNLMTKLNILQLIRFVKSKPELEKTLIVLGGPDVTHNLVDYLQEGADVIVIGEGEQTMEDVARAAIQTSDNHQFVQKLEHVSGIAYKTADGSVHKTATREKIRDIDALPFPNRHKIDLHAYLTAWKKAHGKSAISISTQRGCPYTCRWCSTAVYGQSYRRRSPQNVVDEIVFLQTNFDFDLIWFVDDVFTVSHKWLQEFHDELKCRAVEVRFECITRADRLNPEVIKILKSSGCFRVWIGAESGSQRIIDAMDRRVEVGQVRNMIRAANLEGIETGTFIMLGYPGETQQDILETVAHLKAANPDLFTITVAYPIKGTGLYEEVENSVVASLPWSQRTDRDLDFKRTYPRKYYDFAVRYTVNAVLWHKARIKGEWLRFKSLVLLPKIWLARLGMGWFMKF